MPPAFKEDSDDALSGLYFTTAAAREPGFKCAPMVKNPMPVRPPCLGTDAGLAHRAQLRDRDVISPRNRVRRKPFGDIDPCRAAARQLRLACALWFSRRAPFLELCDVVENLIAKRSPRARSDALLAEAAQFVNRDAKAFSDGMRRQPEAADVPGIFGPAIQDGCCPSPGFAPLPSCFEGLIDTATHGVSGKLGPPRSARLPTIGHCELIITRGHVVAAILILRPPFAATTSFWRFLGRVACDASQNSPTRPSGKRAGGCDRKRSIFTTLRDWPLAAFFARSRIHAQMNLSLIAPVL